MKSLFLNKDVFPDAGIVTEGKRQMYVIDHGVLEKFIHEDPEMATIQYRYRYISSEENHSVVECIMWNDNRRVAAIGEVTPATLVSSIAKAYPTLTASQRAFDRATIRFLQLEGNVYSNLEISKDGPKNYPLENLKDEPHIEPAAPSVQSAPVHTTSTPVQSESGEKDDGDVIPFIGKNKAGNKTVRELYEAGEVKWLSYIAGLSLSGELKKQTDAVKRFLEAHGVQ